ncbi:MAG: prepilin peptidase [bacterium]|nr:prepilin peptidase [bacterium]
MTTVILFVLGAIVGSFLNVVGLRWDLPRRGGVLSNLGGRSACPSCGKVLRWQELVPIVSFFLLRARCRGCQAKISWQYPLIELWTGLLFATVPYIFIPVFCIYVVITIYDFRHKIIPDTLVYTSILLALVLKLFSGGSLLDWLAGPVLFIFFGLIWLVSRGRAMGFGDAKLGLSVGLLLGAPLGFSAIVLAFWIGSFGSLTYLFLNKSGFLKDAKKLTMKSEVPFAPAIILGAWMSLVFHLDILHVALF